MSPSTIMGLVATLSISSMVRARQSLPTMEASGNPLVARFPDRIEDRPHFCVLFWSQSRRFVLLLSIEAYHFAVRSAAKCSSVHLRCPSPLVGGSTW